MEVNIEITEGCTNFSYLINNVEWLDYIDNKSEYYDTLFLDEVCDKLIKEITEQYQLPNWIVSYLYDGCYETACEQNTFIKLVQNNKNTKEEYLGHCEECGDTIHKWTLKLEINHD